jgi:hypothetical protein
MVHTQTMLRRSTLARKLVGSRGSLLSKPNQGTAAHHIQAQVASEGLVIFG